MAKYRVVPTNSHLFLPGFGRVRPGQIVEGVGLERYVGQLLVEVPDAPGAPVEAPKTEQQPPLETTPSQQPLDASEVPSSPPLTESKPRRSRRAR